VGPRSDLEGKMMKDEHVRSVGYIASRKLAMWEDNNKMELR
jgi:hypothetical protein